MRQLKHYAEYPCETWVEGTPACLDNTQFKDKLSMDLPMDKKTKILIADDEIFFRTILSDLVKNLGHECVMAENGLQALEVAEAENPDLIILDIVMPLMDGIECAKRLKGNPLTSHTPIIMVTSLTDRAPRIKALEYGADEFLNKPVDETEFAARIKNLLKIKTFEDYLLEHEKELEGEVLRKDYKLRTAYEEIKHAYIQTIYRLTLAAERRDKATGEHIRRMSLSSRTLARKLGLPESEVEEIFFASPMHDIGKIGIPDSILLKPGKLTLDEFEIMKTHTTIGAEILKGSDSSILKRGEEVALSHHEKFDGSGYPRGLTGKDIPISGRIIIVADIYDALRSSRPYRKSSFSHDEAMSEMKRTENFFDPEIIEAFRECAGEFEKLFDGNNKKNG